MWSEYSLEVVDAVARNSGFWRGGAGTAPCAFSGQLHRSSVRGVAGRAAFVRRHRDVELTPAGVWF